METGSMDLTQMDTPQARGELEHQHCANCTHWQYLPYNYGSVRMLSVLGYCTNETNNHNGHVLTCAHKACDDLEFREDDNDATD